MLNETLEHAAVLPHELVVGAELDDLAAVEAHDVVGGLDGGAMVKTVCLQGGDEHDER